VICIKNKYDADYAQPLGETSYIPYLCIKVYWSKGLGILIYWLMLKCLIGKEMWIKCGEFKLGRRHEKHAVTTWDVWNHISNCAKTGVNQHNLRRDGMQHEIDVNMYVNVRNLLHRKRTVFPWQGLWSMKFAYIFRNLVRFSKRRPAAQIETPWLIKLF